MQDKLMVYYTIIYDSDPDLVYYFTDFEKVLASVESSLYGYVMNDNDKQTVSAINKCLDIVRNLDKSPIIPIVFGSLQIMINRWKMDQECDIYKVLRECYDKTDDYELRDKINALFSVE